MVLKALLIIAAGAFLIWQGIRSVDGYEAETDHLYGGQIETITCDNGKAVGGKGMFAVSAQLACEEEQDKQRSRAPWWIAIGVGVTLFGVSRFRKARAG